MFCHCPPPPPLPSPPYCIAVPFQHPLPRSPSRQVKDGVRLFEISDVVLRDDSCDTGARNCRRLVATYMGPTAGFEIIHGLVDRIMSLVQVGGGGGWGGTGVGFAKK